MYGGLNPDVLLDIKCFFCKKKIKKDTGYLIPKPNCDNPEILVHSHKKCMEEACNQELTRKNSLSLFKG